MVLWPALDGVANFGRLRTSVGLARMIEVRFGQTVAMIVKLMKM